MKFFVALLFSLSTFIFSQTYCAGDQIGIDHQNTNFEVCYASGNYEVGNDWSLADFNGDLNGGQYYVIFLEMMTTW